MEKAAEDLEQTEMGDLTDAKEGLGYWSGLAVQVTILVKSPLVSICTFVLLSENSNNYRRVFCSHDPG